MRKITMVERTEKSFREVFQEFVISQTAKGGSDTTRLPLPLSSSLAVLAIGLVPLITEIKKVLRRYIKHLTELENNIKRNTYPA